MAELTVTAADVAPAKIIEQSTGPAGEQIEPGEVVQFNASGKYVLANGTGSATAAGPLGIAMTGGTTNITISVLHKGVLDVGDALTSLDYTDPVYLGNTAGVLDSAAGSVSTVVGRVAPAWGATTADKVLRVDL